MISALKKNSQTFRKLTQSKRFKQYFSNTSWLFVDQVFNLAVAFFVSIYVARYLGPADFGLLNFSKSFGRLFLVFCGLGLEAIVVKELLGKADPSRILGSAVSMQLSVSTLLSLFFLLFGNYLVDERITYYLLLLNFLAVVFQASSIINFYFQSQVQSKFIAKVAITKIVITSLLKVYFVYFQYPLIYFGYVILIEAVVGAFGAVIVYQQKAKVRLASWQFDKQYAQRLLKGSWPLVFGSLIVFVYNKTDIIMIKYMLGNAEAGYYSVAFSFTSLWFFISVVLCKSLLPAILNAKQHNEAVYRTRMQQLLRLLVFTGLVIAVFVTLVSGFVIDTFYGAAYLPAIGVVRIQIWAIVFVFIGSVAIQWYVAEGLQVMSLTRTSIGAVINVGLNLLLIPTMGVEGAAIATLVAQFFASFAGNAISAKSRPLFYMQLKALALFVK